MERLTEKHYKKNSGYFMKCSEWCEREETMCMECEKSDEVVDRLGAIEDILGDDYDLDRLRELVEADKDGRCYISTVKIGERVFLPNEKEEIIGCRVQGISLPAHGKNLIIHLGGYPAEYLWSDREGIDWWRTCAAAEAALKGEQDG